jgi:hypothetical protein
VENFRKLPRSVVSWAHFNLHGKFDFRDVQMVDSMGWQCPSHAWIEETGTRPQGG